MAKLIILVGTTCSGKSTWCATQSGYKIISYDDFRTWFHGKYVFGEIADFSTRKLLENGINVILDNTHLTESIISATIDRFINYADISIKIIDPPELSELKQRNLARAKKTGKLIPDDVVEKQYAQFHLLKINTFDCPRRLNEVTLNGLITEHAQLQFLPEDIETILSINYSDLSGQVKAQQGPMYEAYRKGQLLAEATLRKSIFDLAKSGSTPAQKEFIKLIEKRQKLESRKSRR